jgi:hypothetical protein
MSDLHPDAQDWQDLGQRRPLGEDELSASNLKLNGSDCPICIGIGCDGTLHLLIPVVAGPSGQQPADLNGIRLRHRRLSTGEVLDISAPPSHERVFSPICRDIVRAIATEKREPWAAVATTIRSWQSALKPLRASMDKSVQIGLFGELFILELLLEHLGARAVDLWAGPDTERHDFASDGLHIEVKTTRRSRSEHEISRIDQLHAPPGVRLLVVSIQVEESASGQESIATRIDKITASLSGNSAAVDTFLTKLAQLGWSEEMRRSGELVRMNLRDANIFDVDENFPRFPHDLTLPSGVVSVRYTVDLSNIPSMDMSEVASLVKASM